MRLKLITHFEIEECKRRINNAIDSRPFALLFSPCELVGRVELEKFWLQKRNIHFRNPLTRIFYGSISKDEKGTVIEGVFKIHLYIKIFCAIWFIGVIAIGGIIMMASFLDIFQGSKRIIEGKPIFWLLATMSIMSFGIFFIKLGVKLREKEEENTIKFLEKTLNKKECNKLDKKSAIITGVSIIIGFIILGGSIIYTFKNSGQTSVVNINRYEMITPNDTNIIIFDKETGRYWRKYIDPTGGPTEWTEETLHFLNK